MSSHESNASMAWSIWDGYAIELRGFPNASDDVPIVTMTLVGPRGAPHAVRHLSAGHVEQLERALAAAKRDAGME